MRLPPPGDTRLQRPLDELLAKKLARGLVPVRLVGPRGSENNYLIKYLCHETNRDYVSIDCGEATTPRTCSGPSVIETELGVGLRCAGVGATFGVGIAVSVGSGAAYGVAGAGVALVVAGHLLGREHPVEQPDD